MARRTLLYLKAWVDVGGDSRYAIDHLRGLDRERWRTIVATTLPSENRWLARLVPHADEIWSLPDVMPGAMYPSFLLKLAETRGVDVVHVSTCRLGMLLLPELAALPRPPRCVVQLHDAREQGFNRYVPARFDSVIDAYSVVSRRIADILDTNGVSPAKVAVIPPGVDGRGMLDPERVQPRDLGTGFHVLWPARFAEQKDPQLMCDVAAALRRRRSDAVVHAVGHGPLRGLIEDAERRLGGALRVHGLSPPESMPGWYAAAHAVLLTSRYEGFPIVVLESLAMATPVVAHALGVEAVGEGVTLVGRREPERFADELAALAADPEAGQRQGRSGRQHVLERHAADGPAAAHSALYDRLLAA